jgi:hypothetical protein
MSEKVPGPVLVKKLTYLTYIEELWLWGRGGGAT